MYTLNVLSLGCLLNVCLLRQLTLSSEFIYLQLTAKSPYLYLLPYESIYINVAEDNLCYRYKHNGV